MANWYDRGTYRLAHDLLTGVNNSGIVIRALLVNSGYSFSAAHNVVSDISASEISAAGYVRSGITTISVEQDATNHKARFHCDSVQFGSPAAGQTVGGAVFYIQTGGSDATPTNDDLLFFVDTNNLATGGNTVQLTVDATTGVATIEST